MSGWDDSDDDDDDIPLQQLKKKPKRSSSNSRDLLLESASEKKKKSTKRSSDASTRSTDSKKKAVVKKATNPDPAPRSSSKKKPVKVATPDPAPSSKKRKAVTPTSPVPTTTTTSNKKIKKEGKPRELKKLEKAERLQYAMQSFLWWNAAEPPEGCQWATMEHAGVSFPEPYIPHHIKMRYDGKAVDLTPVEEEAWVYIYSLYCIVLYHFFLEITTRHAFCIQYRELTPAFFSFDSASFFAGMDPDGMHLGNPKTSKIFIKNFFGDFKAMLGKKHAIKDFSKCDFEPIRRHLNEQKMIRKAITDDEKKANKSDRDRILFIYGFAVVDGHLERVGNYNMEPPGTFRGRGEHPKMGKLKSRVIPEQVQLNMSECSSVPRCPVPGHAWGEVRHDPQVQWLAQWKENINNQVKYMQLAAQSSFKGKSDRNKYNKAALLCENIIKIRASTRKSLKSKDMEERQLATAVWVIDRLALRVGGEKDTDEEADTVGCCSLRVEHMHFDPNEEGGDNREIELEFLGKDSMLYKQIIDFGSEIYNENQGFGKHVWENFKKFCKGKKKTEEIFDKINPSMLNQHLKQFMDGLTAKVFRTYNASKTLQDELGKVEKLASWRNMTPAEKVVEYNNANREVAILCNHQRSVSKAQENQLETIGNKLVTLKKQKKHLKKILTMLGKGEDDKVPLKPSEKSMIEKANEAVAKAKKMKEAAKTNAEKIAATEADEAAKQQKRDVNDAKFTKMHLWEKIPSKEQVIKKITSWNAKISKMEMDLKHKDDNKEVSLGTSKVGFVCSIYFWLRFISYISLFFSHFVRIQINYMDPRISVAWCKRNEVPIEKIFSKTLRDKFNWAMAVEPDWQFDAKIGKQK